MFLNVLLAVCLLLSAVRASCRKASEHTCEQDGGDSEPGVHIVPFCRFFERARRAVPATTNIGLCGAGGWTLADTDT